MAVAVFDTKVVGEVLFNNTPKGCSVRATFTKLPPGEHGFHIHKAGDLRGEGCKGACDHYHIGTPQNHGGPPGALSGQKGPGGQRHTGDLGNISGHFERTYYLAGVRVEDLWGRSVIVHADPDDYGRGGEIDSHTTGHSGARIACAIIGRLKGCTS